MTATENSALAIRKPLSLADLARRIDLNKASGWGLQNATQDQLNGLALFCQKHELLPGDEVTLYEGRPWITVDGRVTLMRRNRREYRGYAQRPLTHEEKEAWGWDPGDVVIETTVRTVTYGEIKAYGRVSKEERAGVQVSGVRHNPVARHNPVEMAMKRSISRAERLAFGTESFIDDEELAEAAITVIEERNAPEKIARDAAMYDRIYGSDANGDAFADMPPTRATEAQGGSVEEDDSQEMQDENATRSALVASYRGLLADAARRLGAGFVESEWVLQEDASDEEIEAKGVALSELLTSSAPKASKLREEACKKNAALLVDAEAAGVRGLRMLKAASSDSLEMVIKKNSEIGQRIRSHAGDAEDARQGAF
jgi:hypothetical protein